MDRPARRPRTSESTEIRLVSRKRELERELTETERDIPALAIVGAGRVGRAIHAAMRAEGLESTLAGRADAADASASSDVVLLCVPDAAIEEACEKIAGSGASFVGHTSGATGLEALTAAADSGAATFSLHPLQTITDSNPELIGSACAVSASTPEALELAEALARRLGMRSFQMPDEHRATYHAAAVIASNFLVALEESAAQLLERTGTEGSRELLAPLVRRSAANWAEHGSDALTGPIARGDEATVERHLEAIGAEMPELLDTYRALAERTRTLASSEEAATA
jgi:predicted short-subunit dehydrogenase-like oxidoreductase (DUF2520 family)